VNGKQPNNVVKVLLHQEALRQRLLPQQPPLPSSTQAHAAVLLCCVITDEPYTVLTRRSMQLSMHAGQISLPGGRVDLCDTSLEATALRESQEEIGLDPTGLQLLGRLPDVKVLAGTGIAITPVVAWCEAEPSLNHNPCEVDEIIKLPLQLVLDINNYGTDMLERDGLARQFYFLRYQQHYIWGATARILLSLAERAR
jgi:8-oxo-dGTP pyrophosphatase MutT (NUDIX family)